MSAQDIWLRKYHELWEKLEENTKRSIILHCSVEVAGTQALLSHHTLMQMSLN